MQNLQETSEKIFAEIKNLLEDLSNSNSYQEILDNESKITELYQQFSFLKISQNLDWVESISNDDLVDDNQSDIIDISLEIEDEFFVENEEIGDEPNYELNDEEINEITEEVSEESIEVQVVNSFLEIEDQIIINNSVDEDETDEVIEDDPITIEEETIFSEEEISEVETIEELIVDESDTLESSEKLEPMADSMFSFAMEKEEDPIVDNTHFQFAEKEESVEKDLKTEVTRSSVSEIEHHEKKIKLASIKGINITKSLFDEVVTEEEVTITETKTTIVEQTVASSVQSVQVEAESPRTVKDFKLDLNDRLAFSQYLFGGSQSELNEVVTKLNSFDNLDKAQEFLSDVYYAKGWERVDNYAQRLWSLVENKFL